MFKKRAQKGKILVVDDEPALIMIISKYLKRNDYDVITAENGKEAMVKALIEKPDLVLLDSRMPVMDGWETLKFLKKHPELKGTPVIMVTAICEAKNVATASAYGIEDYIAKPFDPTELIERVVQALKYKGKQKIACDKS
jgi:two-component system alkaline phosphatase synthesis response regulator PhoP